MLNDTVRIGDLSGQVERITLRMTVLRDVSGVVHFIPNGSITSVSNETHGWSRALIDVGVAYKENIDQVIGVLTDLTRQLRTDRTFGPLILEEPLPPAVDALGDSAVVLKFAIKTKPNQQVAVKRELLRRIKNRFDELGIELPFPHRTLYHRHESAAELPPAPSDIKKVA
jgi:small conductance mechanosensitive channel